MNIVPWTEPKLSFTQSNIVIVIITINHHKLQLTIVHVCQCSYEPHHQAKQNWATPQGVCITKLAGLTGKSPSLMLEIQVNHIQPINFSQFPVRYLNLSKSCSAFFSALGIETAQDILSEHSTRCSGSEGPPESHGEAMALIETDDLPSKKLETSIYFGDCPVRYVSHNQRVCSKLNSCERVGFMCP